MAEPNKLRPEAKHVFLWDQSPYARPDLTPPDEPTVKRTNWKRLARESREQHERNMRDE